MASSEIPATSEVLLKTDASKQFLDALLGQGWDQWGQGLGGEQGAELMLQIFSAFNLVALAIISALFLWVMALAVAGTAHNETILKGLQSYAQQGKLKSKLRDFQDISNQYGWFIAGSSYWSISWINQETREAMYSGIRYSPPEQTLSEWLGITHGLQDAEAVRLRVDNYIKTAYASRRGISDTTANPSVR